jgi:hypothetical protein
MCKAVIPGEDEVEDEFWDVRGDGKEPPPPDHVVDWIWGAPRVLWV